MSYTKGKWEVRKWSKVTKGSLIKELKNVDYLLGISSQQNKTKMSTDYAAICVLIPEVDGENDNAYLIAAVPDLLVACEEFVRKCESGEARSVKSYAQMKAAIIKAKGE